MLVSIRRVADYFAYQGSLCNIEKLGCGHINSTYLVTTTANKYVLQQINTTVFPCVEQLMENILKVTNHIAKKHFTSSLVAAKAGGYYIEYQDKFYRMYSLIDGTCIENASTADEMYITGLGFGLFQKDMADFKGTLYEVIPDFHNTIKRYKDFENAVEKNGANRAKTCQETIDVLRQYKDYAYIIEKKISAGDLPVRVVHNDAKINNLIIDVKKGKPISVIDLDTVMLGSLLYDFGDAVRSGCNSTLEDQEDLAKIYCNLHFFSALCKGFFVHTKHILTTQEKELLAVSGIVLTYECALRFLTDYLNGDVYFRMAKPAHNLIRARAQLALMLDMIKNLPQLECIVNDEWQRAWQEEQ